VQQYLWSGKTKLNANVPISNSSGGMQYAVHSLSSNNQRSNCKLNSCATLNESKRKEWQQATAYNMYSTTSQSTAVAAVLQVEAAASRACDADTGESANRRALVGKSPQRHLLLI